MKNKTYLMETLRMTKKKRRSAGMSLIETVISMWLMGIILLSVISVGGANFAKKNQNKLEAINLIRSEYQSLLTSIHHDGETPCSYIALVPIKNSVLATSERKEALTADRHFTKIIYPKNGKPYVDKSESVQIRYGNAIIRTKRKEPSYAKYGNDDYNYLSNIISDTDKKRAIKSFGDVEAKAIREVIKEGETFDNSGMKLYIMDVKIYKQNSNEIIDASKNLEAGTKLQAKITAKWLSNKSDRGQGKTLTELTQTAGITTQAGTCNNELYFDESTSGPHPYKGN